MRNFAMVGLAAVFLTAAVQSPTMAQTGAAAPATAAPSSPAEYHLGAGDKLKIGVYGEDSLSGEFSVSPMGKISFPLIGEIDAAGLSVSQVQRIVQQKLSEGFLVNPKVNAEVINFRPFYILGEVSKPGEYPFTSGLTVFNAVASAQGFTYRANQREVYLKHAGASKEEKVHLTPTTPVQPGDTIRISERFF
jgi:protein involved in polysaccharide export with SLBB domain